MSAYQIPSLLNKNKMIAMWPTSNTENHHSERCFISSTFYLSSRKHQATTLPNVSKARFWEDVTSLQPTNRSWRNLFWYIWEKYMAYLLYWLLKSKSFFWWRDAWYAYWSGSQCRLVLTFRVHHTQHGGDIWCGVQPTAWVLIQAKKYFNFQCNARSKWTKTKPN